MTIPYTYIDAARTKAAAGRSSGGTSLTVTAGDGSLFSPAPSTGAPSRLAVWRSGVYVTTLKVTGVSGDVLTIDGAMDGHADAAISTGDDLAVSVAKGDMNELWTLAQSKADDSSVVHLSGAETIAGTKTFSSAIVGSITGTAENITGTAAVANGGTGLTVVGSANQLQGVDAAGTGLEYKTVTAGANVTITHAANSITISASGGGGGVAIGDAVSGGTAGGVLYADGSTDLAQDATNLSYDPSAQRLLSTGSVKTQKVELYESGGSGPSITSVYQYGSDYTTFQAGSGTDTGSAFILKPKGNPTGTGYVFQFQSQDSGSNLSSLIIIGVNSSSTHSFVVDNSATATPWTIAFTNGLGSPWTAPTLLTIPPTTPVAAYPRSTADVGFIVEGLASQVEDLQQWRHSDGTAGAGVTGTCDLYMSPTSGMPTDAPKARTYRFDAATNKIWVYTGSAWVSTPALT